MRSFVYIMSNCSNFLNSSCLSIHLNLEAEVYLLCWVTWHFLTVQRYDHTVLPYTHPIASTNLCHQTYTMAVVPGLDCGLTSIWSHHWHCTTFDILQINSWQIWACSMLPCNLRMAKVAWFAAECCAWLCEELMVTIRWSCDACWKNMPTKLTGKWRKTGKEGLAWAWNRGGTYEEVDHQMIAHFTSKLPCSATYVVPPIQLTPCALFIICALAHTLGHPVLKYSICAW